MDDNSSKFTLIIVFLCGILVFMALTWLAPNIYIKRNVSFETTAITRDLDEVHVNYTAVYTAPLFLPRQIKEEIQGKIEIYGIARVHAFTIIHSSLELSGRSIEELQKRFDECDGIRLILKMLDRNIDNVKAIRLDSLLVLKHNKPTNKIQTIT